MAIGQRQQFAGTHIQQWFGTPEVTMELINEQNVEVREADYDVDTGLELQYRDRFTIAANGAIWAGVWLTGQNGPRGWNNIDLDPKFPLQASHPFALIGRLDGKYTYIGDGVDRFYFGRGSRLSLRTNDDLPGNGSGAFHALVQQWRKV
jgi:hypothetical protein